MKPQRRGIHTEDIWLGLMIGNSRLHWGWFIGETLNCAWDTDYISPDTVHQLAQVTTTEDLQSLISFPITPPPHHPITPPPLLLASVVPSQTAIWENYPNVRIVTLDEIPIEGMYPTLGIDRALALYGAGEFWGFSMLAIDAGTALTFTGADANRCFVGGAILPGLGLQLASLGQKTGQLPLVEIPNFALPPRFALNTKSAIQSGVIYTLLAGIKDFIEAWWRLFPNSNVALTGGDRLLLFHCLKIQFPDITKHLIIEQNLIFLGMRHLQNLIMHCPKPL